MKHQIVIAMETFTLVLGVSEIGHIELVDSSFPNRVDPLVLCTGGRTYGGRVLNAVPDNFAETVRVWIMHRRKNLSR